MPGFGNKRIRPEAPPETTAEKHYQELLKPETDIEFDRAFPLGKVQKLIEDNDLQEEMEGIEVIRNKVKYRKQYLSGALEIMRELLDRKVFRHKSTLREMYDYFKKEGLKLKDQGLPQEAGAQERNTVFALRSLLELLEENYSQGLDYLKVIKALASKLKDAETTLNQPEL